MPSRNTLAIGQLEIIVEDITSTNAFAAFLLSKTKPEPGTVISADFQTDGRGQVGRFWHSDRGKNITLSVITYPSFLSPLDQFQLNIVLALAAQKTVATFLPNQKVKIKWPNDIYVEDQKIAGLLVQLALSGKSIQHCIMGMGLNVQQVEFSNEIPNPTSLQLESPGSTQIEDVKIVFFEALREFYSFLTEGKASQLRKQYHLLLYRLNELSSFSLKESSFRGKIRGTSEDGKLIIESQDGATNVYSLHEIRMEVL